MITEIPKAVALNGMTNLNGSPNMVLMADSTIGAIWRLDTVTGEHSVAFENPLFGNTGFFPLGINGVSSYGNMLHFINSARRMYGRVPLNKDGSASEEVQILHRPGLDVLAYDDLAMDREGNAWIATHPHSLNEVMVEGKSRNFTAMEHGV